MSSEPSDTSISFAIKELEAAVQPTLKRIDELKKGLQGRKDLSAQPLKPEDINAGKLSELDKLSWVDARAGKSGQWVYADICPDWLVKMLDAAEKKSVTFAGYDYRLSTPKPSDEFSSPKSFVWKYHRKV